MVDDPEQSPESGPSPGLTGSRTRWLLAGALMLAASFSVGMAEATGVTQLTATIVRVVTGEGTLVVELDDPAVSLSIDGRGISILGAGPQSIRVLAGQHEVQATRNGKRVHVE